MAEGEGVDGCRLQSILRKQGFRISRGQIQRASISVMNNIAKGFERKSNNEFKHFLYVAKGSYGEVRSMLYASMDLKKISEDDFNALYSRAMEISKILSGLIKTLKSS